DENAAKMQARIKAIFGEGEAGIKRATEAAARMELVFWNVRDTLSKTFAAIITDKDVAHAIDDLVASFEAWLLKPETRQAIIDILKAITDFFSKPDNIKATKEFLHQVGETILAIGHAVAWAIRELHKLEEWFKQMGADPELAAGLTVAAVILG